MWEKRGGSDLGRKDIVGLEFPVVNPLRDTK